jgi:formamidopyrimidine-DNA glycosylase
MIITLEGGLHIVISVLMVGRLQWTEGKHSHVEFILQSTDGSTKSLYYDDYRYMGNILFLTSQELEIYLGKLGPDLLAHALNEETWISPEEWTKIFKLKKYQNRMIADVLVEPAAITGIGNYLRAEILYYARISPIRQVKSLTIEEWELLRQWSHKIILESYSCGGFTLKDFISPDGSKGMYPAVVYGRTQDPQGNKVEKMKLKGRTIHYVPEMQV